MSYVLIRFSNPPKQRKSVCGYTASSVAARCWRRPLAWPRTPTVFGPLACRPPARAGPPRRCRPPARRAKPQRPASCRPRGPAGPGTHPGPRATGLSRAVRGVRQSLEQKVGLSPLSPCQRFSGTGVAFAARPAIPRRPWRPTAPHTAASFAGSCAPDASGSSPGSRPR